MWGGKETENNADEEGIRAEEKRSACAKAEAWL